MYTNASLTFNAHIISHLPNFVKDLGSLDTFSAFPFENYLQMLKQRVKSGTYVLSQSVSSVLAIRDLYVSSATNKLFFSVKYPNNFGIVLIDSKFVPIMITAVVNDSLVSGFLLKFSANLYNVPYPSSSIGIGKFSLSKSFLENVNCINKCICFQESPDYIIFPYASDVLLS